MVVWGYCFRPFDRYLSLAVCASRNGHHDAGSMGNILRQHKRESNAVCDYVCKLRTCSPRKEGTRKNASKKYRNGGGSISGEIFHVAAQAAGFFIGLTDRHRRWDKTNCA